MFALTQKSGECLWIGLSTEARPSAIAGHVLFEIDTNKSYVVSGGAFSFAPGCTFGGGGSTAWVDITGKPSSYTPASHGHVVGDCTGLQGQLDGKQSLAPVLTNTTASYTTALDSKLAGVATGSTANSSDATLLDRANHTGTQAESTVTNLTSDLAAKASLASPVFTGNVFFQQGAPTARNATTTLTIADLLTCIISSTSATAVSLTLPTGTLTNAGILGGLLANNGAFDWVLQNLGSSVGVVTMVAGNGHTISGLATTAINTSSRWRTRKTATNTFVTYRIG